MAFFLRTNSTSTCRIMKYRGWMESLSPAALKKAPPHAGRHHDGCWKGIRFFQKEHSGGWGDLKTIYLGGDKRNDPELARQSALRIILRAEPPSAPASKPSGEINPILYKDERRDQCVRTNRFFVKYIQSRIDQGPLSQAISRIWVLGFEIVVCIIIGLIQCLGSPGHTRLGPERGE